MGENIKEIEFTGNSIVLREEVHTFGEKKTEEMEIGYDERDEFEINIDTKGNVSLESLFDVQYSDDDDIASIKLRFDEIPSIEATAQRRQATRRDDEAPPIPRVDESELEVAAHRNFYNRMRRTSSSQPADIRQLIYEEQELNREEFNRLVEDLGYASDGGGINASLIVLEEITEEIERRGRGENQTIVWTGS